MIDRRTALVSALAVPLGGLRAHAQQRALPVVGYLGPALGTRQHWVVAFQNGLATEGFADGRNVTIEYRDSGARDDLLPSLAAELAAKRVAVLAVTGPPAALAAKRATENIPIVFVSGVDSVRLGLVSSLGRPAGNATGIFVQITELAAKRLALLREMVPGLKRLAILINRANASTADPTIADVSSAARRLGLEAHVFSASTGHEIATAMTQITDWRADALYVGPDPLMSSERAQLVELAKHHKLPASYFQRDHVEIGGLMSYGADFADANRQVGLYVGRILKGARPADLPVLQPTRYELLINKRTADTLGLTIPPLLQTQADEVIE